MAYLDALNVAALQSMEGVAEHINEMQRIHDEYGQIFDELRHTHAAVGRLRDLYTILP